MRTSENDTIEIDLPLDRWIVVYNPDSADIRVGRSADTALWSSREYLMRLGWGDPDEDPRHLAQAWKVARLFIDFHTIVVRDRVDAQAAHREFTKIHEYRIRTSPDIDG